MAATAGARHGGRPVAPTLLLLVLLLVTARGAAAVPAPDMRAALHRPGSSLSSEGGPISTSGGDSDDVDSGSPASTGTAPTAIRLAFADSDDGMTVMWSSQAAPGQSCVQLCATAPESPLPTAPLPQSALLPGGSGSARLEPPPPAQTVCGSSAPFVEPATGTVSQHLSTVALTGLAPGQHYRYRCGSDVGGWSAWRTFRAKRSTEQVSAAAPVSEQACCFCGSSWSARRCCAGTGCRPSLHTLLPCSPHRPTQPRLPRCRPSCCW